MIFIDSGAFIARYIVKDQYHSVSVRFWNELDNSGTRMFTSSFVMDETLTFLGRVAGYAFAAQKGKKIYFSERFIILRPTMEDELKSLDIFEKYADQKISFTDCVSFVLMNNCKIKQVFTFDRHFQYAGYDILPKQ